MRLYRVRFRRPRPVVHPSVAALQLGFLLLVAGNTIAAPRHSIPSSYLSKPLYSDEVCQGPLLEARPGQILYCAQRPSLGSRATPLEASGAASNEWCQIKIAIGWRPSTPDERPDASMGAWLSAKEDKGRAGVSRRGINGQPREIASCPTWRRFLVRFAADACRQDFNSPIFLWPRRGFLIFCGGWHLFHVRDRRGDCCTCASFTYDDERRQ